LLQGGAEFDQSPVTDANHTCRLHDSDRYIVGVGGQYEVLPNLTVQAAYAHVFFALAEIVSEASTTSGVLVGNIPASSLFGMGSNVPQPSPTSASRFG
jgi:long-chain fatty acid transport protein